MSWNIFKEKVLITVKTYPSLSRKYDELVCTAWITENWDWIRIYPIPFRKFKEESQYSKYQWIEIDLIKNNSDPRPESFRPYDFNEPKVCWKLDTWWDRKWTERKELILKNIYKDLTKLIADNKGKKWTSLAVFKPTEIIDFFWEEVEREWDQEKLKGILSRQKQMSLFEEVREEFKLMPKLPYVFKYKFKDENWKESNMMIEDWEIWQLYWNCFNKEKNEKLACEKVKEKYFDNFAKTKDLHFFLWTTRQFDWWANNPFVIIGAFYPPKDDRLSLF